MPFAVIPIDSFFSCGYGDHRDLHPFPTRRSSDLGPACGGISSTGIGECRTTPSATLPSSRRSTPLRPWVPRTSRSARHSIRSEEHTSELQSRENLVCRLLLEKKNNTKRDTHDTQK